MSKSVTSKSPVLRRVAEKDVSSAIAVAGHPIHAMAVHFPIALVIATLGCDIFYWWSGDDFWLRAGLWSAGAALGFGVLASMAGTMELIFVPGIRARAASWTHAIAAMMLISIIATNWGLRLASPESILPVGLFLSVLGSVFTGLAGWHGGKLILHHGVGIMVSDDE
ncbi:DUF2231 domain-containing protein [Aureimonas phyllosphaerae]|uniref:Putative membrane protein n=1 Tax=Aureimonas phyllosphaerae TaxID=1166078 RepID=A0A7W6BSJ5_9HYPH|nr:DUF2231 domain-containing protein [Aureimonas phyllosphaerae]MBB3935525.1 putative membrane protein [Aureimonas phyllosphaerae]MBB3959533.1 putative membrane protein [Aureimonas phyllosphaerae]SFF11779.1 Uncharacterized membrane protein [Aureimonas phyllosphaerae]